jgi:hypothetical protein
VKKKFKDPERPNLLAWKIKHPLVGCGPVVCACGAVKLFSSTLLFQVVIAHHCPSIVNAIGAQCSHYSVDGRCDGLTATDMKRQLVSVLTTKLVWSN